MDACHIFIHCCLSPTVAQQLSVCCLLEDDDGGSETGQRDVQATAAGQGFQLPREILQVSPRRAAQELEHVVVEPLGTSAVDYDVRHRQDLTTTRDKTSEGRGAVTEKTTKHTSWFSLIRLTCKQHNMWIIDNKLNLNSNVCEKMITIIF